MALDAGSVYATLGGNFNPGGFIRFGAAMRTAQGQMDAGEKRMRSASDRTSASLHAMGTAAKKGAGVGILAFGAAVAGSVKKAADFEAQLSSLGSVANASGKQMNALRKQAMDAGAATKYSALEAAAAQTELAKGGLSVQKILGGGLKGALALAAAGEMDLADAASTTANALNLFKLNADQATHVADAMATAANVTTADVKDFAMALTQSGSAAKAAGLSFDETMVGLEALAAMGIKGSDAGTSLKAALTQLASPTEKSIGLMDQLGLKFFDAQGAMKPLPQVADMLRDKLGGLTKQQRLSAATTLVGTDGMRALLALYDAGGTKLEKYGQGLRKQGTAADVAAKKQDNLKGRLENLQGSVETAAIQVGTALLPMFEKLAVKATDWINNLSRTGQLDTFAAGVVEAFTTMGEVLSNFANFGRPVIGVLLDLGRAVGMADASTITALAAGFAAFKVAGVVAPMIATLAGAMGTLGAAAKGGTLATLLGGAVRANPFGIIATGAGLLAGALVALSGSEKSEAEAARDSASAKREQTSAMNAALDATLAAADATFGARHADEEHARAKRELANVAEKYGKNSRQYRDALNNEREASLGSVAAHKRLSDAKRKATEDARLAREASTKAVESAKEELQTTINGLIKGETSQEDLRRAVNKYTDAQARAADVTAVAALRHLQLQRLLAGGDLITTRNARAVARLAQVYDTLPKKVQTRIDALPQSALVDIGTVLGRLRTVEQKRTVAKIMANTNSATAMVLAFKALLAGVPARKVAAIVANTSGRAEVDALRGSIAALQNKSVTVTTTMRQITQIETRRGRAQGVKTSGPELAWIGEGRDPVEWVIPRDPQYRGRALGLLQDAMKNLLPGYAKGTKTGKVGGVKVVKPKTAKQALGLPIPQQIAEGGVDFSTVASDHGRIHGDYARAVQDRKTASDRWKKAEHRLERVPANSKGHNYDRSRSNARDAVAQALKELKKTKEREERLKPMATYVDRLFKAARSTDSKAKGFQNEMNVFGALMQDADRKGDQAAYGSARTSRQGAVRNLIILLQRAYSLAKPNSAYGRQLREQLVALGGQGALAGAVPTESNMGEFGGEFGDPALSGGESTAISDAESAAKDAADKAESEAKEAADKAKEIAAGRQLSDADQARLDELTRDFALAQVDTPDDLTDDVAVQQKIVDFAGGVLAGLRSSGTASPRAVAEAADTLRSARSTLRELATSSVNAGGGDTGSGQEAIAAAVAEQMAKGNSARMDLYRDFGSNFLDRTGATIINNFKEQPADPHTWSRGLEFELRQAV